MGDAKAAARRVDLAGPKRSRSPLASRWPPGSLQAWARRTAADERARSYPRRGGVVVPPELARFCEGVVVPPRALTADSDAAAELAATAARAVVQRMARTTYALPRPLLELRLPSPAVVLQTYVIDERTRRVLERAAPLTDTKSWTLGAYLGLPRFGPFCLVDLLAARAEAPAQLPSKRTSRHLPRSGPQPVASHQQAPAAAGLSLDELSALLMRAMPLGGEQVAGLLAREGATTTVRELARAYRSAGRAVPFRVIHHGGCDVIVAPSVRNVARGVLVAATQFISWWGLTTVHQIVSRAQLRTASTVSAAFTARVLASLPKLVWLDHGKEWFSFRGHSSALLRAIRAAFAAAERVQLPAFGNALAREKAFLARLPAGVWERYLSLVAGCTIDGNWILRAPVLDALCPA